MEQMKDLLLTYNEYNKELGYVQGMSDLLAPIYAVIQDDAIAFWAFQHFMDRMERNFLRDQSGMRTQLTTLDQLVHFMDPKLWEHLEKADSTNFFFFFRMLLVWYKREFPWMDILRLWEAQWTDYKTSSFHLFVALAILEKHRDVILTHLQHFDEVLKYGMLQPLDLAGPKLKDLLTDLNSAVNELSGSIDLESTLIRAEALFRKFQRLIEAIDKKNNFPAPRFSLNTAAPSLFPLRPSPPPASNSNDSDNRPSTPSGSSGGTQQQQADKGKQPEPKSPGGRQKVITPELRRLLSREVVVLPRKEVVGKGDGFLSKPAGAHVR